MQRNTTELEAKLQCISEKCDILIEKISKIETEYVHKDMTSLLLAARECAGGESESKLRVVRRNDVR